MTTAAAPRSAAPSAIARPSPVEAPVTTATKPSRSPLRHRSRLLLLCRLDSRAGKWGTHSCPRWHGDPSGWKRVCVPLLLNRPEWTTPTSPSLAAQVDAPASPDAAVLERVPNPQAGTLYLARFTAPEFTALCPVTGQPDFARLVIDYAPADWLIESKSLKLYLGSFRNHGAFHEDVTLVDRQEDRRGRRADLAAHRRLLVPARRHPDRRLLADRPRRPRAFGCPTRASRLIGGAEADAAGGCQPVQSVTSDSTSGRTRSSGGSALVPRWTKPATRSPSARPSRRPASGVVGVPVGDPVGAVAHRLGGDDQRHADRAGREPLLPLGDVAVRRSARDHRHGQRRRLDLAELGDGLVAVGPRGGDRLQPGDEALLGLALQHHEAPGESLPWSGTRVASRSSVASSASLGAGAAQRERGGRAAAGEEGEGLARRLDRRGLAEFGRRRNGMGQGLLPL